MVTKMNTIYLHIQFLNYPHIRALYSESFFCSIMKKLYEKLYISGASIYMTDRDSFTASIPGLRHEQFEALQTELLTTPLTQDGTAVLPVLSITRISPENSKTANLFSIEYIDNYINTITPPQYTTLWRAHYERDMQTSIACLTMLENNHAHLTLQPIYNIADGKVLYQHASLDFCRNPEINLNKKALFDSFESVGIQKVIDRYCLSSIIEKLEKDQSTSISYKLTAASLVFDNWWENTIRKLTNNASIARRLIIEADPLSLASHCSVTNELLSKLKALDCKISLHGHSINAAFDLLNGTSQADYIKFDSDHIVSSRNVRRLIKLIKNPSPKFIASNVEQKADIAFIKRLGITHIQLNQSTPSSNEKIIIRPLKSIPFTLLEDLDNQSINKLITPGISEPHEKTSSNISQSH